jgi:hypothetical protein
MNEIIRPPEPNRLPIDAFAKTFGALTVELKAITSRAHSAGNLDYALDRASWDKSYSKLDIPAAITKLNALRAQFIPDIDTLDGILTKPATKGQVKSLAGIVPRVFGKTDVTHIDHWLATVFMLLAEPISAPVMANAIRKLLAVRRSCRRPPNSVLRVPLRAMMSVSFRDEIIRLAALPPPRLPELPPPKSDRDDTFPRDE